MQHHPSGASDAEIHLLAPLDALARTYDFRIIKEKGATETALVAINNGPVAVLVTATFRTRQNIASNKDWPLHADVPAYARLELARLYPADRAQRYAYEYEYKWSVGPVLSWQAPGVTYQLPFPKGMSFQITQAEGCLRTSHNSPEGWFAVDIGMPRGTPILAARGGMVFEAVSCHGEGRHDPDYIDRANLVRVMHDDGTIAEYVHLLRDSLKVAVGQPVAAGDCLGLSGNSGFTTGPHLHFGVQQKQGHDFVSMPIDFVTPQRGPFTAYFGELLKAS